MFRKSKWHVFNAYNNMQEKRIGKDIGEKSNKKEEQQKSMNQ